MATAMNAQFRLEQWAEPQVWLPSPTSAARPAYRSSKIDALAVRPRRVNLTAGLASLAIVAGAFGSFVYVGGRTAPALPALRPMMIIQMRDLSPPPRPDPAPVKPAKTIQPASAVPLPTPTEQIPQVSAVDAPATVATNAPPLAVANAVGATPPAVIAGPPVGEPAGSGELSARMVSADPPRYPMQSRRLLEQGTVVLAVLLSAEGSVMEISVAKSSGFLRLDEAALRAVRRWRWMPAFHDGGPVLVRGMVTIPFILKA